MATETTTVRRVLLVLVVEESTRAGARAPVRYTRRGRELPAYTEESDEHGANHTDPGQRRVGTHGTDRREPVPRVAGSNPAGSTAIEPEPESWRAA